jgi:hypothetical protein
MTEEMVQEKVVMRVVKKLEDTKKLVTKGTDEE